MANSRIIRKANKLRMKCSSFFFRPIRALIEKQNSIQTGKFLIKLAASFLSKTGLAVPYFMRMQVDFFQIHNPLESYDELPEIEILIPCTSKDFEMLSFSISSVVTNSNNPISKVTLVTPTKDFQEAKSGFPELEILSDEEVLSSSLISEVKKTVPDDRWGWTIQQLIKVAFARASKSKGVLIWDSDTILTLPTTWLTSSGKQLMMFSHEYHLPYVKNTEDFWGEQGASVGMSFVTHHQLMKPTILIEMFPDDEISIAQWIKSCDWESGSAFSEYHSYGTWLSNTYPDDFSMGVWGNQSDFRGNFFNGSTNQDSISFWVSKKHRGARSISLHDYMN